MQNNHLAMCGLDCAECDAFVATAKSCGELVEPNDGAMRQKVAEEWSARYRAKGYNRPDLKASDINCYGCLSDGPIFLYCSQCKIRQCGLDKGLKNCQECSECKCEQLIEKQSHFWKSKN